MAKQLTSAQKQSVSRIGGLVLINAMIFQEILADHDGRVKPLGAIIQEPDMVKGLQNHWQFIVSEINYFPIFHLASQILADLTANPDIVNALRELAGTAQSMVTMRAALRHDLMGRIYHRLLAEAKYLGTYYTSIPAATLLLRLSLPPQAPWAWHDIEEVEKLNVADLACGTGTLLMATADAITHNYINAAAAAGEDLQVERLQNKIAEEVLYGFDVLPSAIHLTASTLALRAPDIPFTRMNLYSLTLGGKETPRLGSIEYLRKGKQLAMFSDLFGATQQVTGGAMEATELPSIPELDLCVMNPPFTRSVGGNLLFGSIGEPERGKMQTDLKRLVKQTNAPANITAGLGSVFVATADPFIKKGGGLSLVLPKALISGAAWAKTRDLIRGKYAVRYIIVSQDPERWNFSESTSLSEAMLVAVKLVEEDANKVETTEAQAEATEDATVTVLNLWRNPTTTFEALAIAQEMLTRSAPDMENGQGALSVSVGNEKVGEAISMDWAYLRKRESWMLPAAFAQNELVRAAYHLEQGNLWLPGFGHLGEVPIAKLKSMGRLGPDRRDIYDGFATSDKVTAFPAYWGHDAETATTLAQTPNAYLSPLAEARKTRKLRNVHDLWPLSSRLLIAERMWLYTQKLIATRISEPVLANVWWTFVLNEALPNRPELEKVLAMWLNSSLGLLLILANRDETRGAWVDFKKPSLMSLPVLDLPKLTKDQLAQLADRYDAIADNPLKRLSQLGNDDTRNRIDNSFMEVLNLPDFSVLRKLLAREPVICLERL